MPMQFRNYLTIFITTIALSSCSVFQSSDYWPDRLPPQDFFIESYQADTNNQVYQVQESYLDWVRVFYLGNALSSGWLELTEELVSEAPENKKQQYAELMGFLGQRIGTEWAKDNRVRLIDTRSASVWRDALIEAISVGDLDNYMLRFEADVSEILAGSLDKEEISFTRYYEEEVFEFC